MMYLHTYARPLMQGFAVAMITHGNYTHISAELGTKMNGDGDA